MSKTIDERVVKMQFDNSDFEKNVKTSMSTLDKLKSALKLDGASKGLTNVQNAVKKFDMSGVSKGVLEAGSSFSALEVMGVTALANLTNSAVNYAKRIVNAFTLEPLTSGFSEYELKMSSVQTIMASTGASLEEVNTYLAELNEYSDKTIYSFSDMTNSIGKFTNAGVSLDKAVLAIKGVSNEAAVSGANANEASRAMYNFAQALSAGYVKLIDWKSIENANMATVEFKQQLIDTAVELGTLTEAEDGYTTASGTSITATQNFNDSLQDQWMTTDVLVDTLSKYADETTDIGKKAYASAQDVKTFSMMMDTLKEAAQSGWATSWEIIIGDFEQAKSLFTDLSNFFSGIIGTIDNARNAFLKTGLGSRWDEFTQQINDAGIATEDFEKKLQELSGMGPKQFSRMIDLCGGLEQAIRKGAISSDLLKKALSSLAGPSEKTSKSVENATEKLKYFQDVVDKVWQGDYGNEQSRFDALAEAGYDYAKVQELVNKTVDGHRLTLEDLGEEQLKSIGCTKEEADVIRQLAEEAEEAGTPLNVLIDSLTRPTGRELLFETIKNLATPLITIFKSLHEAWGNAFPQRSTNVLYNIIDVLNKLSKPFSEFERQGERLTRIFTGLFNALGLVWDVLSVISKVVTTVFTTAFSGLAKTLGLANTGFLETVACIADTITGFRNLLHENDKLEKFLNFVIPIVETVVNAVKGLVKALWDLSGAQEKINSVGSAIKSIYSVISENLGNALKPIKDFVDGLKSIEKWDTKTIISKMAEFVQVIKDTLKQLPDSFSSIPQDLISGFRNGISEGISSVLSVITGFCSKIIETFKTILGIHSPSVVMMAIGGFLIAGLSIGISDGFPSLLQLIADLASSIIGGFTDIISKGIPVITDLIKTLVSKTSEGFSGMDFGSLFVFSATVGFGALAYKMSKVFESLISPIKGLGDVLESTAGVIKNFGGVLKSVSKYINAKAFQATADGIFTIAKSIALLTACLIVLGKVDPETLKQGGIALGSVAAGLGVLSFAIGKMDPVAVGKVVGLIWSIAGAIMVLAIAIKMMSGISSDEMQAPLEAMTVFGLIAAGLVYLSKYAGDNADKAGTMLLKMAGAMVLLAVSMKIIAGIEQTDLDRACKVLVGAAIVFALFTQLSVETGAEGENAAKMLLKMCGAIMILALAMNLLAGIEEDALVRANAVVMGAFAVFGIFTQLSISIGEEGKHASDMLLKMCVAIGILALAMKLLSTISITDTIQGGVVIGLAFGMFYLMTKYAEEIGPDADKTGSMLLKMSFAIGVLVLAVKLISWLSIGELIKGGAVIAAAMAMFGFFVNKVKADAKAYSEAGTLLLKMSVAILILVAGIAILSMLDPAKVVIATLCVSILLGMFSAVLVCSRFAADSVGALKTMAIAIGVLVGSLALLTLLDSTKLKTATGCLTIVMGMFALLMCISKYAKSSVKSIAPMLLVVGGLAAILALLSALPVESSLAASASLSILLLSMAASLALMSLCGEAAAEALIPMAIMTAVVAVLSLILKSLCELDPAKSLVITIALSTLLLSMSACCLILAGVGTLGAAAYIGVGALVTLIAAVGGLMVGIGALAEHYPKMEEFLDKGLVLLEKIGRGIGEFFGNIVGGFLDGATSGLVDVADNLSDFMDHLQPFLDGASNINPEIAESVKTLMGAIMYITGAEILDAIASFITGGSSLSDFADQLVPFGEAMAEYSEAVKGINPEAVTASATAAQALAELNNSLPSIGGLVQQFTGEKMDLTTFGAQLVLFGTSMMLYSNEIKNIDAEAIQSSATAAQALSQLYTSLPSIGGVIQYFTGEKSLSTFGSQLELFGSSMKTYSDSIINLDPEAVTASTTAAQALVELNKDLPSLNGVLQFFTGQNNLSTFGTQIVEFGKSMAKFSKEVKKGKIDEDAVKAASNAGSIMATLANKLPEDPTWLDKLFGDSKVTLEDFGTQLAAFGTKMAEFSSNLGDFNPEKVTSAVESTKQLSKVLSSLDSFGGTGVTAFVDAINELGTACIDQFVAAFENAGPRLSSAGTSMMEMLNAAISNKTPIIKSTMNSSVETLRTAISNKYSEFKDAGTKIMEKLKAGISENVKGATTSMENAVKNCKNKVRDYRTEFYNAGNYLVEGFAQGISENAYKAEAQSKAMAKKAKEKAEKELGVASPSKVFYGIGGYVAEGFANGISAMSKLSTLSAENMANSAIDSTSKAMSRLGQVVSDSIDVEPTISPVMDMSNLYTTDVQLGAGINASLTQPIDSLSTIITNAQDEINASNNRVISAINDLREDINNLYNNDDQEIALYVDAKKLATSIAKPMNRQLNILSKRGSY